MTDRQTFAGRLLEWWASHGRHDLPWQHPRTPYRVWVSEIMLQQTQVSTVIPYFERFMARFPNLAGLAGAPLDDVLALWSGLGYYARARNLYHAAQMCVERHGGRLPETAAELAALPGIGPSTANAIVSQSQDLPAVVLDGNVRRVLARHAAVDGWPGNSAVRRRLWKEAELRLPAERGADYTQAIMDLGATVCARLRPDCPHCPVRKDCRARMADAVERYPAPKPRRPVPERTLYMLVLTRPDGSVLLERRPPAGIWGGLWSLPEADSPEAAAERAGVTPERLRELPPIEHRLSHRLLTIRPMVLDGGAQTPRVAEDGLRWHGPDAWGKLGLPRPTLDILRSLPGRATGLE